LTALNKDWEYFQRLTPYLRVAMKGALSPIISDVLTNKFTEIKLDSWFDGLMNKIQEDFNTSMEIRSGGNLGTDGPQTNGRE
jgi:hypothetical protein